MGTEEPTLARGTSAEAEPERDEPTESDAELIEQAAADAEAAAKARELPAEAKAQQMTPEEYDAIGKGKPETAGPGGEKGKPESPGKSESAPGHNKPQPKGS